MTRTANDTANTNLCDQVSTAYGRVEPELLSSDVPTVPEALVMLTEFPFCPPYFRRRASLNSP
jgi:hypothetical protein